VLSCNNDNRNRCSPPSSRAQSATTCSNLHGQWLKIGDMAGFGLCPSQFRRDRCHDERVRGTTLLNDYSTVVSIKGKASLSLTGFRFHIR
jgi:hypothetical protein